MVHKNYNQLPLIGISSTLLTIESGCYIGRKRCAIVFDYIQAIEQAGGIPFILPVIEDPQCIKQQMDSLDGLLLSGGCDLSPLSYGEEPKIGLETVCPERDHHEICLTQIAKESQKPILGICRGLQLLNVVFGGTLYQDIERILPDVLQHSQKSRPEEGTHTVFLAENTILRHIMGEEKIVTNSFHHQSIKKIAPGLIINAQTSDGVIEGVEGEGDSFVLGVQWHPELMINKHSRMLRLFQAFVKAAKDRAFR